MDALKPRPFCGSCEESVRIIYDHGTYEPGCSHCGTYIWHFSSARSATRAWNRRAVSEKPADGVVPPVIHGLTAPMLRQALNFICPDGSAEHDEDELSTGVLKDCEDGPGIYVWMTEYPDEGAVLIQPLAAASKGDE